MTAFLYDGDNVAADYSSSNAGLLRLYVTPGLDENLSVTDRTSGTYYYSQDGIGSTRLLTDKHGSVSNIYDYTGFGENFAFIEDYPNKYRFQGREIGITAGRGMYFRYRHYNAEIGMFLTPDPQSYDASPLGTVYNFVSASPVRLIDPYGLQECAAGDSPSTSGFRRVNNRKIMRKF